MKKTRNFILVRLDPHDFALDVNSIDGITEYSVNISSSNSNRVLAYDSINDLSIPIINLKRILNCPKPEIRPSKQSRVIILSKFDYDISIGIYVDAIIGFYNNISFNQIFKSERNKLPDFKCYMVTSEVKINSKIVPILNIAILFDIIMLDLQRLC